MDTKLRNNVKFKFYSSFETHELEKILKMDFQTSESGTISTEDIHIIINILKDRIDSLHNTYEFDIENGWNSFKDNYLALAENNETLYPSNKSLSIPHSHKFSRMISGKIAASLLVFFIAFGCFSTTTTAHNLFSKIASWSDEIFWFNSSSTDTATYLDNVNLEKTFGLSEPAPSILPTWIPENYILTDTKYFEDDMSKILYLYFDDNTNTSSFKIKIYYHLSDSLSEYEKDSNNVTIIQKDGIDYYIMSNLDTNTAIWKNENFECQIDGEISRKTLKAIINTISHY